MTTGDVIVVVTVVALMALIAWFDLRCLADLSQTSDAELRYVNRNAWALIIVLAFPIGPLLYLWCTKGPRPYA